MPNRIIKESICTSDSLDQLSAFHEVVFYRLIVNCDDYGRMDARPKILASKLFPLKDIRAQQMEDALRALTSAELVTLYEVGGKPFLQMNTWDRHQQVRAKKSKYPAPESGKKSLDSKCNQMQSNDTKCPRNPIQSNPNPNPNPNPSVRAREDGKEDDGFGAFWAAYPKKTGDIDRAYFEYRKALNAVDAKTLLETITWQAEEWSQTQESRFMPSAEKWLHNRGWEAKKVGVGPRKSKAEELAAMGRDHNRTPEEIDKLVRNLEGI